MCTPHKWMGNHPDRHDRHFTPWPDDIQDLERCSKCNDLVPMHELDKCGGWCWHCAEQMWDELYWHDYEFLMNRGKE